MQFSFCAALAKKIWLQFHKLLFMELSEFLPGFHKFSAFWRESLFPSIASLDFSCWLIRWDRGDDVDDVGDVDVVDDDDDVGEDDDDAAG